MKTTCIAVIPILFSASFCAAQTTTTGSAPTIATIVAHQVERLTVLLTLTAAQQTSATTFFTTEQTALAAIQTSLETAQTALETAVEANSPGGITTAATQIGTLTTQQFEAVGTANAAFYAILTADQQTKYKQLLGGGYLNGGFPGGGPGHGPGGPH
jgi:Spy/CpxP family protein refolding chaperone